MSVFPDGLFQYGGQPVGSAWGSPWAKTIFVDTLTGNDGYDGSKPTCAKATIASATAAASRGDVIYIRPLPYAIGHGMERYTECVTITATNTALNLAGTGTSYPLLQPSDISIIGCVNTACPEMGVRWKFSSTYCLINDTPALHVENIGFFAEDSTAAVYLRNNGSTDTQRGSDGTTFYNCNLKGGAIYCLHGGDGLTVSNCTFHTAYGGGSGGFGAIYVVCSNGAANNLKIVYNHFYGGSTTEAPATCYITLLPPAGNTLIAHNTFGKIPTDGHYFNATGSTNTGQVLNNWFGHDDITLETDWHVGGMVQAGNYDTTGLVLT